MKSSFSKIIFWTTVLFAVEFCISKVLRMGWGLGFLAALAVCICWMVSTCIDKLTEMTHG